jgi:hypothetical protein
MDGILSDVQALWLFFLTLTKESPLWVWTPWMGMGVAWGLTNLFKRWLTAVYPIECTPDDLLAKRRALRYDLLIETVAVICGGFVTYLLMGRGVNGALVGFATAVLTPYGWRWAVVIFGPIGAWWKRWWARRSPERTPAP